MENINRIHIVPIGGDEPVHIIRASCWCQPLVKDEDSLTIHHAKDGREKYERQGITHQDKAWALVRES